MTEWRSTFVGPSISQSLVCFFSKRHSLQIQSSTSPHWSLRAVTRNTSSPRYHKVTFPLHFAWLQLRCASTGFRNQTLFLNRKVLSVSAPTGHTSMIFPIKSSSREFWIWVGTLEQFT